MKEDALSRAQIRRLANSGANPKPMGSEEERLELSDAPPPSSDKE